MRGRTVASAPRGSEHSVLPYHDSILVLISLRLYLSHLTASSTGLTRALSRVLKLASVHGAEVSLCPWC